MIKLVFILVTLVVGTFSQATIPCTYTDPNTQYTYDLSSLANGSQDYVVAVTAGTDNITTQSYKIVLNVCRPIKDQSCAMIAGANCDACQEWPLDNPKYANALGTTTATILTTAEDSSGENGEGVSMLFGGFTSTVVLNFVCDTTSGTGYPRYITKPTSNQFILQWKSKYGCAVSGQAKSRVYCDCHKADVTLCSEAPCPDDVDDLCTYQCFAFGGVEDSFNNYCNYNTTSDICS